MTHLDDAALDEAQVREAVGDTILLTTHNGLDCGPDPTPIHNVALMIVEDVFRPLLAAVRDAQRRAQAAEAALQRVRELHQQYRAAGVDEFDICPECSQHPVHVPWPCDTIRALDQEDS